MNTLLIFFAFPISVIIISIILEKLLKNPIAVASLIFAIFIVVTFAAFDETFLIATLAYTIISLITALIVHFLKNKHDEDNNICDLLAQLLQNNVNNNESVCDTVEDLLGTTANNNNTNSNSCNCGCNRFRRK